jgi:prepilin-type N-terminal cleavage/methylation domain-containing protein
MTASFKKHLVYHKGFTLVEFLVVFSIAAVIIAVAFPALNTFNTNQILKSSALELKTNLRQAQNNAMSGVKNCGIPQSNTTLIGWFVRFDTTDNSNIKYIIAHHCSRDGSEESVDQSSRIYSLKGVKSISISPTVDAILFKPVARGASFYSPYSGAFSTATLLNVSAITITLTGTNSVTTNLTISSSGEINVEK